MSSPRTINTEQIRLSFGEVNTKSYSNQVPNLDVTPSTVSIAFNRIRIREVVFLTDVNIGDNEVTLYFFDKSVGSLIDNGYENTGFQGIVSMPKAVVMPWEVTANPVYGSHASNLDIVIPVWQRPTDQTRFEIGVVLYNDNGAQLNQTECLIKYEKMGM